MIEFLLYVYFIVACFGFLFGFVGFMIESTEYRDSQNEGHRTEAKYALMFALASLVWPISLAVVGVYFIVRNLRLIFIGVKK